MPIRDEAINVFMGLPGDGPRLELTYNFGVDAYELGTGYNHIAITADDLDATLARLAEQGIEPEKPPYTVSDGRHRDLLRARSRRLPDRAHRTWRLTAIPGWRSSTSGRTPSASSSSRRTRSAPGALGGWWKRTDEIYEPVRIGAGVDDDRRARRGGHGARERGDRGVRALLRGRGPARRRGRRRRDAARSARRRTREEFLHAGARGERPRDPRALPRGGGALRLPRRGELDRPDRRRRARHRRRLAPARAGARPARRRARLLAPRRSAHDRALPARRRPGERQAAHAAARPRRAQARARRLARRTPSGSSASAARSATSRRRCSARSTCRSSASRAT